MAGSEVPFAGGGENKITVSTLENVKKDYEIYNSVINKGNSNKNSFSLVVEPRMFYTNDRLVSPNFKNIKKLSKYAKANNFFFEAHSTDYQEYKVLKKLVDLNFKFLKVGPELTFKFFDSIKAMLELEKKLVLNKSKSNLYNVLNRIMIKKDKYWKDYYKGSISKINYLKFNSFLDRIRYYWEYHSIKKAKTKLFSNINKISRENILKNISINKKILIINKKYKLKNSDLIILNYLHTTLIRYYSACGY